MSEQCTVNVKENRFMIFRIMTMCFNHLFPTNNDNVKRRTTFSGKFLIRENERLQIKLSFQFPLPRDRVKFSELGGNG